MQPDFRDAGSLDESSPTPLYLQLQHLIQQAVRSGKLRADEALPSERDLSRLLGISRVTVRKAIAGLVEKGMLKGPWVMGEQYTICDPYLYTIALWLEGDSVDLKTLPKVAAHMKRMADRPAVKKVMGEQQAKAA